MLLFVGLSLNSQNVPEANSMTKKDPEKESFWDRVYTGGNLGLQFGTITFIDVSPLVGYKITDKIHAGLGLTYQYQRYDVFDFETHVYGGRVFGRYFFTDYLFAHAEYEHLNLEAFDFRRRRVDVTSILGGAGFFQRFSENSGVTAMILYNFTQSAYTPYSNPIFRVGFNFGF